MTSKVEVLILADWVVLTLCLSLEQSGRFSSPWSLPLPPRPSTHTPAIFLAPWKVTLASRVEQTLALAPLPGSLSVITPCAARCAPSAGSLSVITARPACLLSLYGCAGCNLLPAGALSALWFVSFVVASTEFVCTNLDVKTLGLGSCVLLLILFIYLSPTVTSGCSVTDFREGTL